MTKFATLTPEGEKNVMSIDMSKVKSDDPIAYAYGFFKGKSGQQMDKAPKGDKLAKEYIRGFKEGRKARVLDPFDKSDRKLLRKKGVAI
jgi:hypothetical protein